LIPGRQDNSERNTNPVIRSADLIVAPLIFFLKTDKELRIACQKVEGVECRTPTPIATYERVTEFTDSKKAAGR